MEVALPLLVFILGLMFGSFANVVIYRLPKGKSIVYPGSSCPTCNRPIAWFDNIPLISWLLLQGKCRHCKKPISSRYFVVELITGVLFLAAYIKFGPTLACLGYLILILSLIVMSFIDIDTFLISDCIVLPGIAVGLIFAAVSPGMFQDMGRMEGFVYSLIGMVVGGGTLFLIGVLGKIMYKKDAMGGGDVKLLAMIGAFLGWKSVLLTVFFSSLVGSLISLTLIYMKKKKMDDYIPFGPYLALGAIIALFWKGFLFMGFLIP